MEFMPTDTIFGFSGRHHDILLVGVKVVTRFAEKYNQSQERSNLICRTNFPCNTVASLSCWEIYIELP